MHQTILVPLDGSPAAEHALPWAISVAQQEGASLHLIRVHFPPAPIMVGSELAADITLDDAVRQAEIGYLQETSERVRRVSKLTVHADLLEGSVGEAIHDHALRVKSELIVMTTHGRGAFARFWLGSVADRIVRQSTVPALMIRPPEGVGADLTVRPFFQRVVIPLDGSDLAERIIAPALKLGKACGADFSLVLVLEAVHDIEALASKKVGGPGGWFPEATGAKAEAYLQHVAHRMRGHSVAVHLKVIEHGSAASSILEHAQTHGHSVIALATHGRSGLKRMLLGGTADKVVRGATCPVLIYHPADA
jgi:nucleotide-binding universal stress UspA family protein